jgi:tRNA-splicing ligase RtcB (3'-phosphate/5'-hydroxy nucleic acid ligase)
MFKMQIKKISKFEWEIPMEGKMNVPGKIFASDIILEDIKKDKTIEQIKNVACLPGIIKHSLAMPDAHLGYGFSIGGVAGFDLDKGVISPGGVGYDINCSIRLLRTNLDKKDIEYKKQQIADILFNEIPTGVGKKGRIILKEKELDDVLRKGAKWAVDNGYGHKRDCYYLEEEGCMDEADPNNVSRRAKSRGIPQLGSLGAGNHFLEIQSVEEIFDEKISEVFGLKKDQIVIMIHCGSRGLGHQVASDYIQEMEKEYGFKHLPDRELVCAPIKSDLGKRYFSAMAAAANFGFANKQLITHWVREAMKKIFPHFNAEVVYEVCHNIAKFEEHKINNKKQEVLVMRKGATRSFGPGRKELPKDYSEVGQPIILPGSMGTPSYVLVGTEMAEELSFSSTAHGAGRVMSRISSKKSFSAKQVEKSLSDQGIFLRSGSVKGITEEAPGVYKDINEIARISHEAGLGRLVAMMKPQVVIKG